MRHYSEDELVLYHYGESRNAAAIDEHLTDCPACGAAYRSIAATLVQNLTVGPNPRLELRRNDDQSFVDVEMQRGDWLALRDRLQLATGSTVHLLPRKVTRFDAQDYDPAAMI